MADNKLVWKARKEFFTGDFPTPTLVQVAGLASPEILLEITVEAHVGCSSA
jgi:enamine deaminase RidA (YjgF/YER057c/UK114 family)